MPISSAGQVRMGSVYDWMFGNKHTEALLRLLVKGILVICHQEVRKSGQQSS